MTQQDYEELKAEVKKTMMAELFKTKKNLVNYEKDIYDYAFDRAYALGIENFQQDSDANWEKNMTQTLKTLEEAEKSLGISEDDITDAADWIQHVSEDAVQGIIKLETISQVIKVTKLRSDVPDRGTTYTTATDAPSTKLFHGLVDAENATTTEPTYLNKSSETCTDNCSSQNHFVVKDEMVDIRLQVASIAMASLLANPTVNDYTALQDAAHIDFIVEDAVTYADALIAKCEEEGKSC